MKNLIQVELEKLEPRIKWVTNMINEAENEGVTTREIHKRCIFGGCFIRLAVNWTRLGGIYAK